MGVQGFLRVVLLVRCLLYKAHGLSARAGLVHLLQLEATVNALPDGDRVSFSAFGGFRLHDTPITVVEAVRKLHASHFRVGPFARFKYLVLSALSRAAGRTLLLGSNPPPLHLCDAVIPLFVSRLYRYNILLWRCLGRSCHDRRRLDGVHLLLPVGRNLALANARLWLPESVTNSLLKADASIAPNFLNFEFYAATAPFSPAVCADYQRSLRILLLLGPLDHLFQYLADAYLLSKLHDVLAACSFAHLTILAEGARFTDAAFLGI